MSDGWPYDPEARRDTPLALKLKARIRAERQPIPVHDFVGECLHDPDFGYYRTSAVVGARGDFVTAPEISQTFGELIGLWAAVVWQSMGEPSSWTLAEIGPGRGTLMADGLRAASKVPGFLDSANIELVDISASLIAEQRKTLASVNDKITWHDRLPSPKQPRIVISNEYLDTCAPWQFLRTKDEWVFRGVGVDANDRLVFAPTQGQDHDSYPETAWPDAPIGSVRERPDYNGIFQNLTGHRLTPLRPPVAGLFIDYGHFGDQQGDGLQAIRAHRFEHPLTSPGEADMSWQVDFAAAAREAQSAGLVVDGPITQAEFLGNLGIMQRASKLMAANPAKANEIETGVARLMAPNGMGTRFKVLGVRSKHLPPLPGFPVADGGRR